MKQLKNAIMGAFVLLFLVGCGPKVTTTKTQDVALSAYETFAYLPNGNFEDPSKGYDDPNVGEMVINEAAYITW